MEIVLFCIMPRDADAAVLREVEACVDAERDSLELLKHGRETAWLHATAAFENRALVPSIGGIGARYAFNLLVQWIRDSSSAGSLPETQATRASAEAAFDFATKYDRLQAMYRMWHRHAYGVTVQKPLIRFEYPRHGSGDRDIASHLLWQREEQKRLAMMSNAPMSPGLLPRLAAQVELNDDGTITYPFSEDLWSWADVMTSPALVHTLPLEATNGKYTFAQSRMVWHALLKLALIHRMYFMAALKKGVPRFDAAFLRRDRERLVEEVAQLTDLDGECVATAIDDLTVAATGKVDLRAQPLIPGYMNELWIVPSVLLTLLWEPCTCILWARLHRDAYSREISSHKVRLAHDLSARFDANRWAVSAMRKLKNSEGDEIGDADVAVYDPVERYLILIELKWLIPPEDIHEVLDTDEALIEGVDQAVRARDWVTASPGSSVRQLFPRSARLEPPLQVEAVVLCRGALGSESIGNPVVPIYDYDQCVSELEGLGSEQLSSLMSRFARTLELKDQSLRTRVVYQTIRLCGADFRVPSIEFADVATVAKKLGRNEPCDCNSGLKFKRCCGR